MMGGQDEEATIEVSLEGRVVGNTSAAAELLGRRPDEDLSGMSLVELGFSLTLWNHIAPAMRALGALPPMRTFLRSKAGPTRTLLVAARPSDAGGALLHLSHEGPQDKPEEPGMDASLSEAWEWKRAFQFAARHANIGIAINTYNKDGRARLVFMNQTGCDMLGVKSPPAAGGDPFPADNLLRAIEDRGEMVFRVGNDKWFSAGAASGHYWGRAGVYVIFTEVTQQRARLAAMDAARRRLSRARTDLENAISAIGANANLPHQVKELMEAAISAEQLLGEHGVATSREKPATRAASK